MVYNCIIGSHPKLGRRRSGSVRHDTTTVEEERAAVRRQLEHGVIVKSDRTRDITTPDLPLLPGEYTQPAEWVGIKVKLYLSIKNSIEKQLPLTFELVFNYFLMIHE